MPFRFQHWSGKLVQEVGHLTLMFLMTIEEITLQSSSFPSWHIPPNYAHLGVHEFLASFSQQDLFLWVFFLPDTSDL